MPYRVLLVDDVPAVREALRWALEEAGDFEVVGEAGDGEAALLAAAQHAPDVVILDIEMPRLDGYAVARRLKTLPRPPTVIFLSVHNDLLTRQQSAAAGGDGFAAKGTGWPGLLAQVRQSLQKGS